MGRKHRIPHGREANHGGRLYAIAVGEEVQAGQASAENAHDQKEAHGYLAVTPRQPRTHRKEGIDG
jgi:hypothetical protein